MTTKKRLTTLCFYSTCVLMAIAVSGRVQAATQTLFQQQIGPLTCTVSTVQTGTGLATSGNCGTYVPVETPSSPATPTTPTTQTPVFFAPSSGTNNPGGTTVPGSSVIYINELGRLDKQGGYLLELRPGSIFTFRLIQDGSTGTLHTVRILQVGEHGVVLSITPDGKVIRVPAHGQYRLDINRDGFVDVSFRTEHVSDDNKTALLRAIFYSPKLDDRVHKDPTYEIAFTVLFSGAFVGLAHLYHRLIRSPLGHREWLNHTEK